MDSAGKYLKTEREIRNLSIEEVSSFTKIRLHLLRAIEEDRYGELPPWPYLKGFLTGYAKHLGLDPVAVLRRYDENLRPIEIPKYEPLKPQAKILSPAKRFKALSFFTVIPALGLFVLVLIYYDSYEPHAGFSSSLLPVQESMATQADRQKLPAQAVPLSLASPAPVRAETDYSMTRTVTKEPLPFEISSAALGTGIETEGERLLLRGEGSAFLCDGQKVYFFTKVQARKDGKILHVWIREDKEVNRIEMDVRQPAWSVYSYLTLQPLLAGTWKVEARDGDDVLSTLTFKAIQPSPAIP
jgi:Helix-turn-helix domain/Protein of unknown function (DUF2914)